MIERESYPLDFGPDYLETRSPLSPELARAAEAAAEYLAREHAPNTRRTFAMHWRAWCEHCVARGIAPVPVRPEELILYLTHRGSSAAPNTVRSLLTAISCLDQRARTTPSDPDPAPVRSAQIVRSWLRGWSRDHPIQPRRAAASITLHELDDVIQIAQERPANSSIGQHVAQYARDRCMLLLGMLASLRVSELVAIDVEHVTEVGRGLRIFVARSKSDQSGKGRWVGVMPQGRTLRCAVDAWGAWMGRRGRQPGPAFVRVERDGTIGEERLHESAARRMISRRAKAAGLELVSSHSMRASFATLATEKRKPPALIARHGGWSGVAVMGRYIRQGELFDDNPTSGLLDD